MPTVHQLANLRPPIRPGEVRNPEGRNQWSDDRERRAAFRAVVHAIDAAPEEASAALMEKLARLILDGALDRNHALMIRLLDRLWPVPPSPRGRAR